MLYGDIILRILIQKLSNENLKVLVGIIYKTEKLCGFSIKAMQV